MTYRALKCGLASLPARVPFLDPTTGNCLSGATRSICFLNLQHTRDYNFPRFLKLLESAAEQHRAGDQVSRDEEKSDCFEGQREPEQY